MKMKLLGFSFKDVEMYYIDNFVPNTVAKELILGWDNLWPKEHLLM